MAEKRSPVIVFTAERFLALCSKLEEYKKRLDSFRAPELQMDTVCKVAVLEHLLRDGQVNTWELSREMLAQYGRDFDPKAFNNACGVIEDYCQTGGQKVSGGTGFR